MTVNTNHWTVPQAWRAGKWPFRRGNLWIDSEGHVFSRDFCIGLVKNGNYVALAHPPTTKASTTRHFHGLAHYADRTLVVEGHRWIPSQGSTNKCVGICRHIVDIDASTPLKAAS